MIIEAVSPIRVAIPRAEYMMEILIFSAVDSPRVERFSLVSVNSEDALSRSLYGSQRILTGCLGLTSLFSNIKS